MHNELMLRDLGYVIVRYPAARNRSRGRKGEVVEVWAELENDDSSSMTELSSNDKVYFRVDWCTYCRKYKPKSGFIAESPPPGGKCIARCHECFALKKKSDWSRLSAREREVIASVDSVELLTALLVKTGFLPRTATVDLVINSLKATDGHFKISFEETVL